MIITNKFPKFLYGTAWKEERTEYLVGKAIKLGFRGIDTANQRVHYFEQGKKKRRLTNSSLIKHKWCKNKKGLDLLKKALESPRNRVNGF